MGHRRNRKQERRNAQGRDFSPLRRRDARGRPMLFGLSDDELGAMFTEEERRPLPVPACGNCREFIPDEDAGRGECLHPGSGILMPWSDTPPCAFHTPRGRAGRAG